MWRPGTALSVAVFEAAWCHCHDWLLSAGCHVTRARYLESLALSPCRRVWQMQGDEPSAFVAYDRFEQVMLELLESGEFAPDGEDTLLAAFRVCVSVCP